MDCSHVTTCLLCSSLLPSLSRHWSLGRDVGHQLASYLHHTYGESPFLSITY